MSGTSESRESRVSVIIPTYNRAEDLRRALRSVASQTYQDWEVIVVDNNSTDATDDVIAEFAAGRVTLVKVDNDGVIGRSRNIGVDHARGDVLAFLDSDDWWLPGKLDEAVKLLDAGNDLVYHDLFLVKDRTDRSRRTRTRALKPPVFTDLLQNGNAVQTSSVAVRKELLVAAGGFSEEPALVGMEDYDLWVRLSRLTDRFALIPKTLGYYWVGGGNVTNDERTLKLLGVWEERYFSDFADTGSRNTSYWLEYARGRLQYKMGDYEGARKSLHGVLRRNPPIAFRLKTLLMLTLIALYKRPRRRLAQRGTHRSKSSEQTSTI